MATLKSCLSQGFLQVLEPGPGAAIDEPVPHPGHQSRDNTRVYLGSQHEAEMFAEFGRIQEEAHKRNIAAIAWVYPRGATVTNDASKEIVAYAARTALELGADAAKIKYTGDPESFSWAVKSAAKMKVFMSGGPKAPTDEAFLRQVKGAIDGGATGLAVGRNVWQHRDPLLMADYQEDHLRRQDG